jgi:S-adenosylmethionine decarboxylase
MENLIYNYTAWVNECDPVKLSEGLDQLIEKSGYTLLNKMSYHFQPQGYTCLWLLAESHLAVHTFPENGKTYIELSSCNQEKNENFKKLFKEWQSNQNP